MNTEEMKRQFDLLKNITRYSETADLSVDLSQIEEIIFKKLPEEIKKNAPLFQTEYISKISKASPSERSLTVSI